ncbi:hypothetical protein VP01_7078g1 [Puccinia sorghi]|uniref:Uncharacterized protein n=1 Tax=Puccinia sorghi TaxID=27349 RepID=A0A0L6UDS1_9BASI|nr:hypothetical protein VP01_7078g1 [Puccinia sorghi]
MVNTSCNVPIKTCSMALETKFQELSPGDRPCVHLTPQPPHCAISGPPGAPPAQLAPCSALLNNSCLPDTPPIPPRAPKTLIPLPQLFPARFSAANGTAATAETRSYRLAYKDSTAFIQSSLATHNKFNPCNSKSILEYNGAKFQLWETALDSSLRHVFSKASSLDQHTVTRRTSWLSFEANVAQKIN